MLQEMRSSERFPIKAQVAVKTATEASRKAETTDISGGGVLFVLDSSMAVGSSIEFSIALPASLLGTASDVIVHCTGRVMRCVDENGRKAIGALIDEYRFQRPGSVR